ncbi:hypothetical protein, partial [Rubrivirga sp.]|uniref:hypothetical protein n=1 Tax=Rubrivirga sp. TaxID=1885344 RepID=UPI003C74B30C
KATSRNYPVFAFAYCEIERLVIADNVILNGASGGIQIGSTPPRGSGGEVVIQNNFILNNLLALRTRTFGARTVAYDRLTVRHNSFILNFPYNPDPTSSNVSAVEWHNSNSFGEMVFEGNLFAFNPGGAFQSDWQQSDLSDLTIRDNLFFTNGALFGEGAPEAAVVAGKFGTNPTYRVLDLYDVEDDLDGEMSGNVTMDPQLPVAFSALQAANSGDVNAQVSVANDVRRMFGINTDGGTVAIANFAPQMMFSLRALPLPQNPEAQAYGVQTGGTWGLND